MTPPRGVEDAAPYKTWRKLAVACRGDIYASRALGGWRKAPGRDKSLPYNNYTATAPGQFSPASALPASPSAP